MLDVGAGSGHTLKKVGSVVRYVTPLQKLVDKSFGINKSVWRSFWDQSRVEDAVGAYRELAFPKPPEVVVRARSGSLWEENDAIFSRAFLDPQWCDVPPHRGGPVHGRRVALTV